MIEWDSWRFLPAFSEWRSEVLHGRSTVGDLCRERWQKKILFGNLLAISKIAADFLRIRVLKSWGCFLDFGREGNGFQ